MPAYERYIRGQDGCREVLLWGNNNIIDSGTLNAPPVTVSSYPCGSVAAFVIFTIVALCWHVILSRSLSLTFSWAAREDVSVEKSVTSRHIRLSLNCSPALFLFVLTFFSLQITHGFIILSGHKISSSKGPFIHPHKTEMRIYSANRLKTHSSSAMKFEFLSLISQFLSLSFP